MFRPAAPPSFNPAEDAPHTFEPGRPSPLQPGPRPTRVLPETPETRKEPGLWAATPPRGSVDESDEPSVLGVRLPFPPGASNDIDKFPVRQCAKWLSPATLSVTKVVPSKERIPCLVAFMLSKCLTEDAADLVKHIRSGRKDLAPLLGAYKASIPVALAFIRTQCPEDPEASQPPPADRQYLDDVLDAWRALSSQEQPPQ